MDLPFLKKSPSPEPVGRQYLFAIEISPEVVKAAVWTVVNNKTQVLSVGSVANWDNQSKESLIAAVDQTLTDAANHLDPSGKIAPDQAILGLSATWVHDEKIIAPKLAMLKDLAHELEIKLVGFVVTPEAVVKYLQFSENVPPSAILIGLWPHFLELTLVKLGKIQGIQLVNRSVNIADDVVEGLSRFANVDMLPSRMLLYDSGLDLEEVKQLLLAHPWQAPQKKLPFLHFPKIETLPPEYTVRSIALAGGSEVARAIGMLPVDTPPAAPAVPQEVAAPTAEPLSDLGFVREAEVALAPTAEPKPMYQPPPISRDKPQRSLPKFSLPALGNTPLILAIIIVLVICGLGAAYWYLPKATVTIYLQPKTLNQNFALTADTQATAVDPDTPVIPAQLQTATVNDSKSAPTTGTALVGDAAKGSVTILNSTDTVRNLAAGTVLTSPSGLKFTLDAAVSVASGSGSVFNPEPGKATANVTASAIGTDSNLSAGTEFRVASFAVTQIAARNDVALSGGTSKQVKAISKDDLTNLQNALLQGLKSKALDQLNSQVGSDKMIIAESITTQTVSQDFSGKAGDQADNVTLNLKISAQGMVVAKADLNSVVTARLKPLIPNDFSPVAAPNETFAVKSSGKTSAQFTVTASENLLPTEDTAQIAQAITGKYPDQVRDYLQNLPNVSKVDILPRPNLPAKIGTMPHVTKNITIVIKAASP